MTSCWSVEDWVVANVASSLAWFALTLCGAGVLYLARKRLRPWLEQLLKSKATPAPPLADAEDEASCRYTVGDYRKLLELERRLGLVELEQRDRDGCDR